MPIGQIKALSWLIAAALTLGLSHYVFNFITELKSRPETGLVEPAAIKAALEDVPAMQEQRDDVIDYQRVRGLFHEGGLNWTGYEAPKPIQVTNTQPQDVKPKHVAVSKLLRVLMIQYDPVDASKSVVFVRYSPESKVPAAAVIQGYSLKVGDKLHPPQQHVVVKAVGPDPETGRLVVTFGFDDESREAESLGTEQFDATTSIVAVDEKTGKPYIRGTEQFPVGTYARPSRTKTREVSPNTFRLGTEDIEIFARDYPSLINELRPTRHRDPRTGKYDGIEIGNVPSGSAAARHGAETGDVIKSINGHAVTTPSEAIQFAKNNADKYDRWEIVVERRGKEETIVYTSD